MRKQIVTYKCHVDESTNSRYNMILGRDLLTALVLTLKFSENFICGGEGPYKGCSEPMVDVNNYYFNIVMAKTVKQEEPFINAYVSE